MTRHRLRSIRRSWVGIVLVAVPGMLLAGPVRSIAAAGSVGTSAPPGAEAWVVRVELAGTPLVEIGRTSVDPPTRSARAIPLSIGGQGPPSALADVAMPDAKEAMLDWTDQTGSLTVNGGYAEASAGEQRWTARAGLGQGTGTGFPIAAKLLTWDQQTQLLGAVQSFNEAVTPITDEISAGLAPLVGLLGVPVPRVVPMAPSGLVDVGGGRAVGSTAEAAVAPGYSTARADATAGSVRLFGGFITVDAVSSEATVERGATDQVSARSWLVGVHIAGIPVTVDANGIHVVQGGPFEAVLTPAFDALLHQLAAAGLTVRTIATPADGGCCSASAVGLEVALAVPGGPLLVSLGGAQATAPDPLPVPTIADLVLSQPEPSLSRDTPTEGDPVPTIIAATPNPTPEGSAPTAGAPRPRTGMIADLGPDVVRALRLTYLILLGAAAAAAALFTIAGPSRPVRPKRGLP